MSHPTKVCTKCSSCQPLEAFPKKSKAKDGLSPWCRGCLSADARARYEKKAEQTKAKVREYASSNPEKVKAANKARYMADPGKYVAKTKAWAAQNTERANLAKVQWVKRNPDKRKEASAKWVENNYARHCANTYRRKGIIDLQRPAWADMQAISEVYRWASYRSQSGRAYEVDHLYPLQGATVCGLHVKENLAVVPMHENRSKGAKLPGSLNHELWDPSGPDVYYAEVPCHE